MTIEKILSNYLESNMYVLGKDDQVIFIDAGCEVDRVERVVKERKVQGILLTHGHYDHAIFAKECAEKFGTKERTADGKKRRYPTPNRSCAIGRND